MPELLSRKKHQRSKQLVQPQEVKIWEAIVWHGELPKERLGESQIDET
jgi:hypothetical protein